jgi:hypothetical protein
MKGTAMRDLFNKIETLRWDDHRYYHQCRINQTLHFISAISFLVAYALLFINPAAAGLVGWLVGMVTRQSGHIFFEPRGFDHINQTSYENKESIKVGYNMQRKTILIGVWLAIPVFIYLEPTLFGLVQPSSSALGFLNTVGLVWLTLGVAGLAFRTTHLFFLRGPGWGIAWAIKIVTDPFHNIATYWKAPLALLQGQRYDPLDAAAH